MTTHEFKIGAIAKAMRRKSGLTQGQLAEKVGIAQCDISRIESDKANPSIKTLNKIAAGLDMKMKIEFVRIKPQ